MHFQDRLEAGRLLARALARFKGQHPLVLAIPRGAVPMGQAVAEALGGELDVVLVRKIGAPDWAEYAVAAVDESGWVYRNPQVPDSPDLRAHIAAQREVELARIRQRRAQYTPGRGPVAVRGRTVIVVDDGLATGATMIAALHGLRQQQPAQLVCAVPVAPPDILPKLGDLADTVVCLHQAPDFQAVGQFYTDFSQVEDAEVIAVLRGPAAAP
ncbi:MAG: phosphoribosyltransferase family protein [Burkholderiaceae bacterium]|nr:phosphoribosyltransferase family protein [Burkholderiaceae bacterium]